MAPPRHPMSVIRAQRAVGAGLAPARLRRTRHVVETDKIFVTTRHFAIVLLTSWSEEAPTKGGRPQGPPLRHGEDDHGLL